MSQEQRITALEMADQFQRGTRRIGDEAWCDWAAAFELRRLHVESSIAQEIAARYAEERDQLRTELKRLRDALAGSPPAAAQVPAEPGGIARRKRDGLITDGYTITGWLLSKPGERHALMHEAAVRWLTSDDLWALMHISTSQVVPGRPAEMPCEWKLSDRQDGIWTASCSDLLYSFADGGPIENGHKHCHGCGRVLVVAADQADGPA